MKPFLIFLFLSFSAYAADEEAKALLDKAIELEKLNDVLSEKAEKACYWGKEGSADCMQNQVDQYNAQYGAGAFEFLPQLNVIRYTGLHLRVLMQKYPKSDYAAAAEYTLLTKDLVGVPDAVLARVENFMVRHSSGSWNRKGKLLLARLYQDVWWIHKNWSWIIYNNQLSDEELIRRSEIYREKALKLFEELAKKEGSTEEGKAAKEEQRLLKEYKDDGNIYGIIHESMVSG